jgi:plasmid replication initiation protein
MISFNFLEKVTREDYEIEVDIVIRFLERLQLLKRPLDDRGSWTQTEFEVFRFAIHEIFLYLIAVGLKNSNYKFIEELFYTHYFFQDKYDYKKEPETFGGFYNYVDALDYYYKQTYSRDFFSPMADLIIKRIPEGFTKDLIVEADLLCYYIASLNNIRWFPITYVYKTEGSFELFKRMTSTRHFEKVKGLFSVNTANELKEKLTALQQNGQDAREVRYSNSFDSVIPLFRMIDIDKVATTR